MQVLGPVGYAFRVTLGHSKEYWFVRENGPLSAGQDRYLMRLTSHQLNSGLGS